MRIARRYAEALMMAADAEKQMDAVATDLHELEAVFRTSSDFRLFLRSPVIRKEKKVELLQTLFGSRLHAVTNRFLALLAEKGREDALPEIIGEFFRQQDVKLGIVQVDVRAASEITREQTDRIRERFESLTRKTVRVEFSLDRSLRGGFVARVGDTVFDGSVQHQLEELRKRFAETPVN